MEKADKKTVFLIILLIILGAAIVITVRILSGYMKEYAEDRDNYDKIREIAYRNNVNPVEGAEAAIDFEALKRINPDITGWLVAAGGEIDGPVVQAYDDQYYLTHRFDKSEGSAGTFFADTLSNPAFRISCTAVFGHNRKDGSMFHPLLKYKDKSFFEENPVFFVYTEDGRAEYRIVSAFYSAYRSIPGIGDGETDPDIILEKAEAKALYDTDFSPEPDGDQAAEIVILCTCEYSGDDNRMAVYGVKQGQQ